MYYDFADSLADSSRYTAQECELRIKSDVGEENDKTGEKSRETECGDVCPDRDGNSACGRK